MKKVVLCYLFLMSTSVGFASTSIINPAVARIASYLQGIVDMKVKVGQHVKKGELLFQIETDFTELMKEKGMSVHDAIVQACTGRLRAVLLTSVTTFAGLAPLLSETSLQAQFLIPAAAALGYGILFATFITLILTPSLLMIQCEINALTSKAKRKWVPNSSMVSQA